MCSPMHPCLLLMAIELLRSLDGVPCVHGDAIDLEICHCEARFLLMCPPDNRIGHLPVPWTVPRWWLCCLVHWRGFAILCAVDLFMRSNEQVMKRTSRLI
ncbi:hypothetical protein E2562_012307 [Oryza meyeriana var. granulata]|uniref:Secreted protein n=1 Tax=Oryza meyeriana var. granulata TaxID=110450 RepID=A0A6G1DHB0_9ORYZ|nr:hypothetical protein E2562_012307 [Oryza meyeriana var. granulata]KAF0911819.1 hypothetical protein E2562_012307 [Oryza meyeriana var. granulata]